MKHPIAIATTSLIRSPEEEQIVFEAVKSLSLLNIPVILTDGGSSDKQKNYLKSLPNIRFYQTNRGLFEQLKISFNEGEKMADSLFYLHTDKVDFVTYYVPHVIDHYMTLPKNTLLISERTQKAFNTYPLFQQKVELFLNTIISEFLNKKADYYYGPKIFSSMLVPYFSRIKGDIGWGYEAFIYMLNKRLGYPMEFYPVDHIKAPKDVGDVDEINEYRLQIVQGQIEGLLQGKEIKLS